MDEYRIDRLTWQEFDRRRQKVHTVVLPMGATEGYGPHLPLGSDTLAAQAVARLVCERTGAFLGPALPVGDSCSISMFPGTLTVRPESFKEYLRDILDSLMGWGMRNFLFLNGHAGNVPMAAQLSQEYLAKDPGLRFAQIDWWRYAAANSVGIFDNQGYMAQGHASECGTSVMLYLCPELVRRDKLQRAEPKVVNSKRFPNIARYTPFNEFSDLCTIGDATAATAEKGQQVVERCTDGIVAYMNQDFHPF